MKSDVKHFYGVKESFVKIRAGMKIPDARKEEMNYLSPKTSRLAFISGNRSRAPFDSSKGNRKLSCLPHAGCLVRQKVPSDKGAGDVPGP